MKKAKALREATGNPKIFALHEQDREAPGRLWKVTLTRPLTFLLTEPASCPSLSSSKPRTDNDTLKDYLPFGCH